MAIAKMSHPTLILSVEGILLLTAMDLSLHLVFGFASGGLPGTDYRRLRCGNETYVASIVRMMRAGLPAAMELGGIDFVTTDPAPITEFLPIVMPLRIIERVPIQT